MALRLAGQVERLFEPTGLDGGPNGIIGRVAYFSKIISKEDLERLMLDNTNEGELWENLRRSLVRIPCSSSFVWPGTGWRGYERKLGPRADITVAVGAELSMAGLSDNPAIPQCTPCS